MEEREDGLDHFEYSRAWKAGLAGLKMDETSGQIVEHYLKGRLTQMEAARLMAEASGALLFGSLREDDNLDE